MGDSTASVLVDENDVWGPEEAFNILPWEVENAEKLIDARPMGLFELEKELNYHKKSNSPELQIIKTKIAEKVTTNLAKEKIDHISRGTVLNPLVYEWAMEIINRCRKLTPDEDNALKKLESESAKLKKMEKEFFDSGMKILKLVSKTQRRAAGIILRMELNRKPNKTKYPVRNYNFQDVSDCYFNDFIFKLNEEKDDSTVRTCQFWFQTVDSEQRTRNGEVLDTQKSYDERQKKMVPQPDKNRSNKRFKVAAPKLDAIGEAAFRNLVCLLCSEIRNAGLRQKWRALTEKTKVQRCSVRYARSVAISERDKVEELIVAAKMKALSGFQ